MQWTQEKQSFSCVLSKVIRIYIDVGQNFVLSTNSFFFIF